MTPMDHNISSPLGIILLILFGIVSIAALLGNGFIIVVISHSWFQNRKLVPCDLLLTCLSIFRFLLQCFSLSGQYIYISSPEYYICNYALKGYNLGWMYFNMASVSATTCLIVFYCVKVSIFAHPLFLWLKSRIDRLVPCMLAVSLAALVIFSLPPAVSFWRMKTSCTLIRNLTVNGSHIEVAFKKFSQLMLHPIQLFFSAICFSICLMASIVLIVSLWRHTRNLKNSGLGTQDLSTQAHIKVIKQLMSFLFLSVLFFITIIIAFADILKYGKVERLISDIVLYLCPAAHSILLIWTNPKLKRACTRILLSRERAS